mgnify:FL=1
MIFELVFCVIACFAFMLVGAWIGIRAQEKATAPLLDQLQYMFKHVSSHDLQVYHGVQETDWMANRPYEKPTAATPVVRTSEDIMLDAENLAREFERANGDLAPSAE